MSAKRVACFCVASLLFCAQSLRAQESAAAAPSASLVQIPRSAVEKLANVTGNEGLWILLPSNFSGGRLSEADFSLFKLNTDQLDGPAAPDSLGDSGGWLGATPEPGAAPQTRPGQTAPLFRDARKMGLFSNVLNKPKVSPLYLVNGTVCRFVNSQPICTTLSTTGLFRGQTPIMSNAMGGAFQQGQLQQPQQQQQQQQQGNFNNPQQRQLSPVQQGFNNQFQPQNNQFQQFRPAALLEDESQDLNVESSNSSARSSNKQKPTKQQVLNVVQATRPLNYIAQRRPLGLLSFGRPFRGQYQRRGKEAPDCSLSVTIR